MFHPNINENGLISVRIFQKKTIQLNVYNIIISIQSLLDGQNLDEFVNDEDAKLYKEDKLKYETTVSKFTQYFDNYLVFEKILDKLGLKVKVNEIYLMYNLFL